MDILSRYRDASIEDIWNEDNRYNLFYEVELAYLKAEAMLGKIQLTSQIIWRETGHPSAQKR